MTIPFGRQHGVSQRGEPRLVCDDKGLALGPLELAWIDAGEGGRRVNSLPAGEIVKALHAAFPAAPDELLVRRLTGLARVIELLEAGDGAKASLQTVLLGFPQIGQEDMAKLAEAESLRKANPNWADQARLPGGESGGGQWTSGAGGASPQLEQASTAAVPIVATPAQQLAFVRSHLADAEAAAKVLGVPAENILGVSALDSTWGRGKFAISPGNNYFSIHWPAEYANGWQLSSGNQKVSIFASYADNLKWFISVCGPIVRGRSDPADFARALQDAGKFGIKPDGSKVLTYVHSTARTIIGIRAKITWLRT